MYNYTSMVIEKIFMYLGILFFGYVLGKGVELILKRVKKEDKKK